ncbi:DUF3400 domain-containing protein [Candidatus Methylospira mobilis]|uniref:DUF3400 domain-containing protein n=1 Tax=Candidatus Methylospira mobilis TaxID=1808979 RepID=A0A5Q0BJ07_9GAMM|nr:DUF3400 domain-containing protein [Candidatus Methylospira mobilis]
MRLRTPVFAGGTGDAGDAVRSGRVDGAAARLSVLRVSAARDLGEDWMERYIAGASNGGIERILV